MDEEVVEFEDMMRMIQDRMNSEIEEFALIKNGDLDG